MNKKERILNAAVKYFATKGVNDSTMNEIAKEANVGKGTIYNYFKNKEDLNKSIIEYGFNKMNSTIQHKIKEQDDFKVVVTNIIEGYLEFYKNNFNLGQILLREIMAQKDKFKESIEKIRFEHTIFIEKIIQEAIENKIIKDLDPSIIAVSLVGMVNSTVIHWIIFREDFPLEEIKDNLTEIYFNGIILNK